MLINAMKEQQQEIDAQELDELKTMVKQLANR